MKRGQGSTELLRHSPFFDGFVFTQILTNNFNRTRFRFKILFSLTYSIFNFNRFSVRYRFRNECCLFRFRSFAQSFNWHCTTRLSTATGSLSSKGQPVLLGKQKRTLGQCDLTYQSVGLRKARRHSGYVICAQVGLGRRHMIHNKSCDPIKSTQQFDTKHDTLHLGACQLKVLWNIFLFQKQETKLHD